MIGIVSVTAYLHRYSAHRALALHPALQRVFRFWLWPPPACSPNRGPRFTASITPARYKRFGIAAMAVLDLLLFGPLRLTVAGGLVWKLTATPCRGRISRPQTPWAAR